MVNVNRLDHYYNPEALERETGIFGDYYNNERDHGALGNITPAHVHHGGVERSSKA